MEFDSDEGIPSAIGFTANDVATVIQQLEGSGEWTVPTEALDLAPKLSWRPDLVSPDRRSVLHVHLDTRLRSYVVTRLRAASEQGRVVHVALNADQLWSEDVLQALSDSCAHVLLLREGAEPGKPLPLLRALADAQIKMPPPIRTALGRTGWKACRATGLTAYEKGRRLEALLGFLLSQVGDFRVVEYNLRTDTEELDLVVQVSRLHGERCWVLPNHPFIVIEAKNWSSKVGQPEVSSLYAKVATKRGTVRISLLVGANGLTEDADRQVLKFSLGEEILVLLGPEDIEGWIEEGEDYLEKRVRHAMLR